MAGRYENLDDAAAAALFMLGLQKDPRTEHLGALFGDDMQATPNTVDGNGQHVHGTLSLPHGSVLDALFHNHPAAGASDAERAKFSIDDLSMARRLGVPSYIDAGDRIRKFDPASGKTSDVLAAFPWDEYRSYLMDKYLHRAPDDPRGLLL